MDYLNVSEVKNKLEFIKNKLGMEELLCQLSEETAELSKAALKLRRAHNGKNPTPKNETECWDDLKEEIADVLLVETLLDFFVEDQEKYYDDITEIMYKKIARWAERLSWE